MEEKTRHSLTLPALLSLAMMVAGCDMATPPRAAAVAGSATPPPEVVASRSGHKLVAVALDTADKRYGEVAVRALLTNLIDDGDPVRFNDPQWRILCAEQSAVLLDGRHVEAGQQVPDGSFVLDWALQGACPLGTEGPLLFGRLRMLVVRDEEHGLVPLALVDS